MKFDLGFLDQIPGVSQALGALLGVVLAILAAVGVTNSSSASDNGFDIGGSSAIVGQAFGQEVQAKQFPLTGSPAEDGLYYRVLPSIKDGCTVALVNWREKQPVVGTVWSVTIDGTAVDSISADEVAGGLPVTSLLGLPAGADKLAGLYFAKVASGTHAVSGTFSDGPTLNLKRFSFTTPVCASLL